MKIQRTIPPAAAPIYPIDIAHGVTALFQGNKPQERFINELKEYYGVNHCYLVSSGKTALYCILKALQKNNPGKNEVLIPAFDCYSVPSAIVAAGCKIRLCDIDPATLDFDKKELSRELENHQNLLCILPTHLFGIHSDVAGIRLLVDNKAIIIEDAAQAMGSRQGDTLLGCQGDVGFFSLSRGKAFSTYEGGIIITSNENIGKALDGMVSALPEYSILQIAKLIAFTFAMTILSNPWLFWLPKSLPFLKLGQTVFEYSFTMCKLSSFQAGLAKTWKTKLPKMLAQRKKNTEYWIAFFKENAFDDIVPLVKSIDFMPDIIRFPVFITDAKKCSLLLQKSEELGLGLSITYPQSLDNLPEINSQCTGEYPCAEKCAASIVTLPVNCFLSRRDKEKIKTLLQELLG